MTDKGDRAGAAEPGADGAAEPDAGVVGEVANVISELVGAVFDVGESMARMIAEATTGEREIPPPKRDGGPILAMAHYGGVAVTNLASAIISGASAGPKTAQETAAPGAPRDADMPSVHPGSTLRIPLSIQNPGDQPMERLATSCLRVSGTTAGPGRAVQESAIRLEPDLLTIGPRDFEKLSVFVDVPPEAAPGRYEAMIGLGDDPAIEIAVRFEVRPAAAS